MQKISRIYTPIIVTMICLYRNSKTIADKLWKETHHNFVTIDLTSAKLNGKYRKILDCFYLPRV